MIKDAADLFAAKGEGARDVVENMKSGAQDALDLALSEAPSSLRGRYNFVRERVFPLLLKLEDEGERRATLDDVAGRLGLRKTDLRKALGEVAESARQDQEVRGRDEVGTEEELVPEPGTERYERAMDLLKSPHFFGLFVRYTGMLGHVGDYVAKLLALLCALSALMGRPIQPSTHAQSSAGKNALWDAVLAFLPPETVVRRTGLSAKALFRTAVDLSHKVLYVQEIGGSEEADYTIRTLQSDGRLVYEATEKAPDGTMRNVVHEVEGPTTVVQTTTRNHLHPENETRVFPIFVDESARQTRRILQSYLQEAEGRSADPMERERCLQAFRDAFRLLEPGEVVIPYARRIRIPDAPVRVRRDAKRLLDLVRVAAWAHQHQRNRDERGRIVATEGDFRMALGLAAKSLSSAWKSLAPVEEEVLEAIEKLPQAKKRNGFGRTDLDVEGRDGRRVQDALKSLSSTGYLDCDGRKGPQGFRYTLACESGERTLGISLRPAADDEGSEEPDAEEDPEPDHGMDLEGGARGTRGSARTEDRALDGPLSQEKAPIARSRGEEDGFVFEVDEAEGDGTDEGDVDYQGELTEHGWYRAQTVFTPEGDIEAGAPDEDPVARRLRREVGIYQGRDWWSDAIENPTPLALTAQDLFEAGPPSGDGGAEDASSWPAMPEQMPGRIRRAVHLLQSGERKFWDPGLSDWYEWIGTTPRDEEKVCKDANLHAELWVSEGTPEEIWAFVALKEGWRVPDGAIEGAVWRRATSGRSPWADPELLPDIVAPPLDDPPEPRE